jgi:hypothetical protein
MSGAIEIMFSNIKYIHNYGARNWNLGTTSLSNKEYFQSPSQQSAESTVA